MLIIGTGDKYAHINPLSGYLFIDDTDTHLHRDKRARLFDVHTHHFNPFPMSDVTARQIAGIVYGDAGENTLTARNGKRALTRLFMRAKRIDKLNASESDDDQEAQKAVEDLLLSPVLKSILCNPTNFSFRAGRSIVAKIDRVELGEHNAKILAMLLVSQFKGTVIIPDFGFYAHPFYTSLIREQRLIAGVYTLEELDKDLRHLCMLMPKVATKCGYDDAEKLAKHAGLIPDTVGFHAFVETAMSE